MLLANFVFCIFNLYTMLRNILIILNGFIIYSPNKVINVLWFNHLNWKHNIIYYINR